MNTRMYRRICAFVRDKIAGTKWEGHVFTVGGCCRDMVLGCDINDVDFAVDLPGGGIEFADWLREKHLTIGTPVKFEKYGTAMTRLRAFPHDDIEIVQTRAEKYTDRNSRNPETAFGSIKDDCYRRDLTINALYYDISRDKVIDITGQGISDIRNKIIRTPADPDSTFDDDPIRILRTIRFATRLGWKIPEAVYEAMKRNVGRLTIIKPERMRTEFEKILLCPNAAKALRLLRDCGALIYIIPQVKELWLHSPEPWDVMLHTIREIKEPNITIRVAALLAPYCLIPDISQEQIRSLTLQSLLVLKYHNPFIKEVMILTRLFRATESWGSYAENMKDADLRKLQYSCGRPEYLKDLLLLVEASQRNTHPHQVDSIRKRLMQMSESGSDMYSYQLPFAEHRIKKLLHIPPGPLVTDTLQYMMELAFINPHRSKQDFEKLVNSYTPHPREIGYEDELLMPNFNGTPSHKQHRQRQPQSRKNFSRRHRTNHRKRRQRRNNKSAGD